MTLQFPIECIDSILQAYVLRGSPRMPVELAMYIARANPMLAGRYEETIPEIRDAIICSKYYYSICKGIGDKAGNMHYYTVFTMDKNKVHYVEKYSEYFHGMADTTQKCNEYLASQGIEAEQI